LKNKFKKNYQEKNKKINTSNPNQNKRTAAITNSNTKYYECNDWFKRMITLFSLSIKKKNIYITLNVEVKTQVGDYENFRYQNQKSFLRYSLLVDEHLKVQYGKYLIQCTC
jgi:hypothetical protein